MVHYGNLSWLASQSIQYYLLWNWSGISSVIASKTLANCFWIICFYLLFPYSDIQLFQITLTFVLNGCVAVLAWTIPTISYAPVNVKPPMGIPRDSDKAIHKCFTHNSDRQTFPLSEIPNTFWGSLPCRFTLIGALQLQNTNQFGLLATKLN
jgi:hypothetical protein